MPSSSPPSTKRSFGAQFELQASKYLHNRGYQILCHSYRCLYGEVDLIAIHQNTLVLVEVKARSSLQYGEPYTAVTQSKLQKIANTGEHYRSRSPRKLPLATRIDIVSILVDPHTKQPTFQILTNVSQ